MALAWPSGFSQIPRILDALGCLEPSAPNWRILQMTSSAVISPYPLWNWTPSARLKVQVDPSSETPQLCANIGTGFSSLETVSSDSPTGAVCKTKICGLPVRAGWPINGPSSFCPTVSVPEGPSSTGIASGVAVAAATAPPPVTAVAAGWGAAPSPVVGSSGSVVPPQATATASNSDKARPAKIMGFPAE